MAERKDLSDKERRALDDANEYLVKAHAEAQSRLATAGLHAPSTNRDGEFPCRLCGCADFVPGGLMGKCKRSSCGHVFLLHEIPT
jgi:hypothetical protein